MYTKRDFAKDVVNVSTCFAADSAAEATLEATTDIDTDSTSCSIGTAVFGLLVGWKLRPVTDKAVDVVADRLAARKARKNTPSETE